METISLQTLCFLNSPISHLSFSHSAHLASACQNGAVYSFELNVMMISITSNNDDVNLETVFAFKH